MRVTFGWVLFVLIKVWFWLGLLLLLLIPFSLDEPDAVWAFLIFGLSMIFLSYVFYPNTKKLRGLEREKIDVAEFQAQLEENVSDDLLAASLKKKVEMQRSAAGLGAISAFMLLTVQPILNITKTSIPEFINTLLAFGVLYLVYLGLRKASDLLSGPEINPWLIALIQTAKTSVEHGVFGIDKEHPRNPLPEQLLSLFMFFIGLMVGGGGLVHGTLVLVLLGGAFGVMFTFIGANGLALLASYEYPRYVLWLIDHRQVLRRGLVALFGFCGIAIAIAIVVDQFYR